jgi:hypothetical protein
MDTGTLIKIVELINNRLTHQDVDLEWANDDNPDFSEDMNEYNFILGHRHGLNELIEYLQSAIEAEVDAIESNTGE